MRMRYLSVFLGLTALALISFACGGPGPNEQEELESIARLEVRPFGETPEGEASLYTLRNANGMEVSLTNYGGIVTQIRIPDREGKMEDVTLGFDSLAPYLGEHPFFGSLVGRYGNRIGGARFRLEGKDYPLAANNGPNTLHGGVQGFNRFLHEARAIEEEGYTGVELSRASPDGEEGFPGQLDYSVRYLLGPRNVLRIEYKATTDAPTVVNLTHHSYFNLKGQGQGDILDHVLMIRADSITPVNEELIPTGELQSVSGTPFDFREPDPIGSRIEEDAEQLQKAGGYDHNWVLDRQGSGLELAARLEEPVSGRSLEVWTTEPGLQFYSGNFLDGTITGKEGRIYTYRSGLCLETQHFPDSPNQPGFPSTILRPGETYESITEYHFSWPDENN